jgi:frataxin-like iron-binding protein CyaY
VRLLVDHNLPPRLAEALNLIFAPDHEVVSLRKKFGRDDLKDEEWIPALGMEGNWAVLSADMNIAKKKPSRDLFIAAGLVGFFFSPSMQKWPLNKQTARILTIWPQMIAHMTTTANGVFEMPTKGEKFRTIGR